MAQGFAWNVGGNNLIFGAGFAGRSVPALPVQADTITITVDQRSVTQTAGETVVFDLDFSGTGWDLDLPTGSDVYERTTAYHCVWTFDDPYTFTNCGFVSDIGFANANEAIGQQAAHHYRNAGTYRPTVLVFEMIDGIPTGNVATGSMASPLVVADRSTVYTTYCLSNDTDHTGAPAQTGTPGAVGAVEHVNNVTDIRDWYYSNVNGTTTRLITTKRLVLT